MVFGIASDDSIARERPVVLLADRDYLPRVACAEVIECVVTRHTGHAGY
jgi:hypothetical protein